MELFGHQQRQHGESPTATVITCVVQLTCCLVSETIRVGSCGLRARDVPDSKAVFQKDARGVSIKGKTFETYDEPTLFDPSKKHCVLPYQGTRVSITAYTSRGFPKLSDQDREQLKTYGFRCSPMAASAAPQARQTSRPWEHNRVMVDFCTNPYTSTLEHRDGCHVLYVPNDNESLNNKSIAQIANNLNSLCDEGGGNEPKPLLLFASFVSSPSEQDWNKVLKSLTALCRLIKTLEPTNCPRSEENLSLGASPRL